MNNLIQSLPSPHLQQGTTHTWMGASWMVDGLASVMMMAMISSNSPSRQGARTETSDPDSRFRDGGGVTELLLENYRTPRCF
jgi:hypothetical protein